MLIFSISFMGSFAQTIANYSFSGYCFGFPTTFTSTTTSTYTILSYSWDLDNDGLFNDGTGANIQHTFTTADTFKVGLKAVSTNDSATVYTTFIIQSATPVFTINADSQCFKNNNFIFTNSSLITPSGTLTYKWDFGDGTTVNTKNPTHTFTQQNKTFSVKLIATTDQGCSDSISKNATIHAHPQISFTTPDTLKCKNEVFTFTNTSSIAVGNIQYLWDFGDGNQTNSVNTLHSYPSTGLYVINLKGTSVKGCVDSFMLNIHVDTNLFVSFTVNKDSQCVNGNSFTYTNTSSFCGTVDSVVWDLNGDGVFNDGKGNVITHTYTNSGSPVIGMIVYNGNKIDTAYHSVTILPSPAANFSINTPTQNFAGNYFVFTNSSSITPASTLKYKWSFGDGGVSVITNPSWSYTTSGAFSVKLIATSLKGCKDSITKTATVLSPFIVDFTADTVCGKDSTSFVNKSSSTNPILQINWDFNNDNNFNDAYGNNVKHLFSTPGTYTVGLEIITSVDTGKITKQVIVNPKPVAGFSVNTINQNLLGNNFILTNTTTISPVRTLSYLWDFKDASTSTLTNVTHTYSAIGSYYIKLTATSGDGCKDTISHRVNVLANINLAADFTADTVCFQQFTTFTNTSTSFYPMLQINWDLDNNGLFDNGTGQILKSKFPEGIHRVGLQVITAYDTSTIYKDILINPSPRADFMINRSIQPLKGNNFVYTNASLISPYSELTFNWSYGDGNTSLSIDGNHSYSALGSYNVQLIAISDKGCRDTIVKQVQIVTSTLNIDYSNTSTCIGDTTYFTNLTTVTNDSIISYLWDFGDGSPAILKNNPFHIYAAAGSYNVTLHVYLVSGNIDSVTKQVNVYPKPVITINATPDTIIYTGQTVTLSVSGPYNSILWSTGSNSSTIDINTAGIYSVNVVDVNGCSNSKSTEVVILPKKAIDVVTGFSPNGDGINDYWKIINIDAFGVCKVKIYNRWGDLVYSSSNYLNDWDGKRNGKMLPQGTYYYLIETPNDGTYTGPVNIVK